jgi:hypothetical protein
MSKSEEAKTNMSRRMDFLNNSEYGSGLQRKFSEIVNK